MTSIITFFMVAGALAWRDEVQWLVSVSKTKIHQSLRAHCIIYDGPGVLGGRVGWAWQITSGYIVVTRTTVLWESLLESWLFTSFVRAPGTCEIVVCKYQNIDIVLTSQSVSDSLLACLGNTTAALLVHVGFFYSIHMLKCGEWRTLLEPKQDTFQREEGLVSVCHRPTSSWWFPPSAG